MRTSLVLFSLVFIYSCALNQSIGNRIRGGKDLSKIEVGMTQEQVREILGKPKSVSTTGCNGTIGTSCRHRWSYGRTKIRFENGRVSSYY